MAKAAMNKEPSAQDRADVDDADLGSPEDMAEMMIDAFTMPPVEEIPPAETSRDDEPPAGTEPRKPN